MYLKNKNEYFNMLVFYVQINDSKLIENIF